MAQPIDIPAKKSRRKSPLLDQYLFPKNEGPYFGYIELFERYMMRLMFLQQANIT